MIPDLRPNPYPDDDTKLLALCIWREARSERYEAKLGVANVVKNRCALAPVNGFHHSIPETVLQPWQFSSFNPGDPNSKQFPVDSDRSWQDSLRAAESVDPDNTYGAVFYYSPPLGGPPAEWGHIQYTTTIGRLHFYKLKEAA